MAKYYLQSGQVSFCVIAADVEGAALWAMHRVIDNTISEYEQQQIPRMLELNFAEPETSADPDSSEDPETENIDFELENFEPMLDGLAKFGQEIKCSQIGFGREDAGTLETDSIFLQWRQLMRAADRLFDKLN